jgi:hypothetical protein
MTNRCAPGTSPTAAAATSPDRRVMATVFRQPVPSLSVVDTEATETFMGSGSYVLCSLGVLALLGAFLWPIAAPRLGIARWETWPPLL